MIERIDIGDGYIKFVENDEVKAEVYALTKPEVWRVRIPNQDDIDFHSQKDALSYTELRLQQS